MPVLSDAFTLLLNPKNTLLTFPDTPVEQVWGVPKAGARPATVGELIPADAHLYAEFFSYQPVLQVAMETGTGEKSRMCRSVIT